MYVCYNIYICNHENNVPSRLSPQWLVATHALGHRAIVVTTGRAHCFMIAYILCPTCFWNI